MMEKLRCNSSNAKITPASGALKAAARPGAGTAGQQIAFLHAGASHEAADALRSYCAQLDGRAFASQGKTGADAYNAGGELNPENVQPTHFHQA